MCFLCLPQFLNLFDFLNFFNLFNFFLLFDRRFPVLTLLLEYFLGDVVSELAGQLVITRTRVLIVFSNRFPCSNCKFSGQAVTHFRVDISSLRRQINMGSIIWAWTWNFVNKSFTASSDFTEVSHATIFVFGEKIVALFINAKSNRISAWSRNF